jgi:hypothetical protein
MAYLSSQGFRVFVGRLSPVELLLAVVKTPRVTICCWTYAILVQIDQDDCQWSLRLLNVDIQAFGHITLSIK